MGRIRMVLGRTGAGKSSWIRAQIARELKQNPLGPKLFWIVPDALSYTTERHLLQAVPTVIRAEVVHMFRLAERVYAERTTNPRHPVNTTGQRLLLADVFRRHSAELRVLYKEQPSVAFLDALLALFDELSDQRVNLDDVYRKVLAAETPDLADEAARRTLGTSFSIKWQDICLLHKYWDEALSDAKLYHPKDLYQMAGTHAAECELLREARLFVDGYADMSESELAFVMDIAAAAEETVISLCIDPMWAETPNGLRAKAQGESPTLCLTDTLTHSSHPEHVFAPQTLRLYNRVMAAAMQRGLPVAEPVHLVNAETASPEGIRSLEQRIFAPRHERGQAGTGISIAAAQNIRVETDGIAREVLKLHHSAGVPFENMAVLVPDRSLYFPYLKVAFRKHAVPIALDDYPSLAHHPLAKFLLAVFQCIEESFSVLSMLRLLKTDFCQLTEDEADWLETYIRQYEVEGVSCWLQSEAWTFAWQNRDNDGAKALKRLDEKAESMRRVILQYLRPIWEVLSRDTCLPQTLATSIWNLLEQAGAKKVVAEWMVGEEAEKNPLEASMHEQAWQRIMGLVSDLWDILPNSPLNRSFLFQVMKNDITGQSLTSIPAGLSQVLVSDYVRALGWRVDTVFVAGAADGALPRRWRASGLLTDEERTWFAQTFGQALSYTAEDRQLGERFTVYTTLTRALSRLYITYPLADVDGKEIRPASTVSRIRELFPDGLDVDSLWTDASPKDTSDWQWWTESSALEALLSELREGASGDEAASMRAMLFRWFAQDEARMQRLQRSLAGVVHKTEARPLGRNTARALYGDPLRLNVYQLESFAACPFQHFAKYGLRLQEDIVPDVTAAARGTILHDTLDLFLERLQSDMGTWRGLSDEEATTVMREAFESTLAQPKAALWHRRAVRKYQATEVWGVLEHAAIVLTRHARHGLFEPAAMEVSFGVGDHSDLPGFELTLPNGVTAVLRGRVDRIDTVETEAGLAFRIVDYKSSALDIDLSDVEHGLQLQLPVYAAVIERHSAALLNKAAAPAGLIYIPVLRKTTLKRAPVHEEDAREESLRQMKSRGLMVHHVDVVAAMDQRLAAGEASDLFKSVYKKDGTLAKTAPALEEADWQRLLQTALQRVREAAARISEGDIAIAPYMLSPQDTACRFCAYQRLCHIDKRWDARPFRHLKNLSKEEVLTKWKEAAATAQGGDGREH